MSDCENLLARYQADREVLIALLEASVSYCLRATAGHMETEEMRDEAATLIESYEEHLDYDVTAKLSNMINQVKNISIMDWDMDDLQDEEDEEDEEDEY